MDSKNELHQYTSIDYIKKLHLDESEWKKAVLNEWVEVDTSREEKEVFIVARDYNTTKLYAQLSHIKLGTIKYVRQEDDLRGRNEIEIRFITTCLDHERYHQIVEVAKWLEGQGRAVIKEVEW